MSVNTISLPDTFLAGALVFAFILCAFCAASETGLMALNRYRLKHLAKTESYALRISKLLEHPSRLLGVILIGNTFATAMSATIANEIAEHLLGEIGIIVAPIVVTLVLLVFAEVMPKTVAALKPEATARFVARPLGFMLWLLYPLVWMASGLSNSILRLFGLRVSNKQNDAITDEEFRTIVTEAGGFIQSRHQQMLLSILDLEKMRVEHIMIPRNEVIGIDLEDSQDKILAKLLDSQHTLLPVYRSDLDNVQGILHTRNLIKIINQGELSETGITQMMEEPYFVPEGTTLHMQLMNFQQNKRRIGLVVDEYGDVLGLVTLEDILEEIVGEFTTEVATENPEMQPQDDGTFLIEGSMTVRDLNRAQHWHLPTEGPTTLSGLIIETLEAMPTEGVCVLIADYPIEIIKVKENTVKLAKIGPKLTREEKEESREG